MFLCYESLFEYSMAVHWDRLDLSLDFIESSTSYRSGAIWTWLANLKLAMIVPAIVSDSFLNVFIFHLSTSLPEGQLCTLFNGDYKQEVYSWQDGPFLVPWAKNTWLVSSETHPCWLMQGELMQVHTALFLDQCHGLWTQQEVYYTPAYRGWLFSEPVFPYLA